MAKSKYCRYRTCCLIGISIVSVQLLLAGVFFDSSSKHHVSDRWEPSDDGSNNGGPSARRSDEEETNLLAPQTRKLPNETVQGLDLPCSITEKQALSALSRAKTTKCKYLIANLSCIDIYPKQLESLCPRGQYQPGKSLGCFKDEKTIRLLSGYYGTNKLENSPKFCQDLCLQSGYIYAGVQYSNECFCGWDEPNLASKLPDSSCNMKCPGNSHETCGGYFAMEVFETGIKKFVPQVANETASTPPVKIVFLLTLNGRALRQVKRLLKIIYHRDHYYYIHVDVRQDYLYRELLILEKFPNIRLTRKRFATIWGGASLLEMLRSCMSELLAITQWNWEFVLNLSESDYPVKTIERLTQFLSANRNRNFVKSHGREVQRFIQKQGLDKTFVECEYRMWRIGNRQLPSGIQIDGGSDWIALSRPFIQYVTNPDELVVGLLTIFNHTLLPAESFFHTALRNSKFCNSYVDNNLHVTNWKRKLGCKCQYKHVVDWCGCSPNDFTIDDWTKILNTQSRALYFARKFEPIINQAVILQLELWLHNYVKPTKTKLNLDSYWQNVYHYQDLGVVLDVGMHTVADSLARLQNLTKLLQVHSFHHTDRYKYTLLMYSNNVEVAIRPKNKLIVLKSGMVATLTVSSDYDQKEQLSRNFLKNLSPFSDLILTYKFGKPNHFTVIWIDPTGVLREVSDLVVDDSNLQGHVKSTLKQPHLPGIWNIKILHQDTALLQLSFVVIPPSYSTITPTKQEISDSEIEQIYDLNLSQPLKGYEKHLPIKSQQKLKLETQQAALKRGNNYRKLIDSFVYQFYSVERTCVGVEGCQKTSWSSFAPDPKSAIDEKVNSITGTFDIW